MIKLRIEGTEEELEHFKKFIKQDKKIRVLQISDPYKNRGETIYFRVYAEIEVLD